MDVMVFSDSESTVNIFQCLRKSRTHRVIFTACSELRKRLKYIEKDAFIYVDISGYGYDEGKSILRYLAGSFKKRYCVIDPQDSIEDVGMLFHKGACDYIGKEFTSRELTSKRVKEAAGLGGFYGLGEGNLQHTPDQTGLIPSGCDWGEIRTDQEYTFCLMYIAIENREKLKRNLSDTQIVAADRSFRSYIERVVSHTHGRVWIWNDFEGICLFPFNSKGCDAVLTCFRLILSRKVYSVENPHFNTMLAFRVVLHIGNTVYREAGETGTIVSDSVNTVFNIGRKFAGPGEFYLTKQVFQYTSDGLKAAFLPSGCFDGAELMRMRLPV